MEKTSQPKPASAPTADQTKLRPADEAPPETPGTGDAVCSRCGGAGLVGTARCPECEGTGKITRGISAA